jgi:hypothetical protein
VYGFSICIFSIVVYITNVYKQIGEDMHRIIHKSINKLWADNSRFMLVNL